ncbi:threonine aldolase family protein [Halobellus captivus]|uniref:threonine aldolase family protein n=1 Tax=Halobellus captivus TaxID=2592614 RepID=UPI00119E647A|nr:GntG family PLP-dependent aldolase [Halobellus captivus]
MAIDLRSDTVTRPSDAMREAAADAPVGDDVYGEDPTVNELEAAAADRVGTGDALYVPTGTMGNQIAARVHAERGEEIILDERSHIYCWELGGLAQLSGIQPRPVDADDAVPTPGQIDGAYVEEDLHRAGTGLVALENTHNGRGGVAVPPEAISAAADAAHDRDVPVHLDGARLFNACVALDVEPPRMVRDVDSVLFCLSKGLGAPVGSILAGSESFIEDARRIRKLFGGGMRQAGVIAAPGLLALENVERLAIDHDNAAALASGLDAVDGLRAAEPDTNIVQVFTDDLGVGAEAFIDACAEQGVLGGQHGPNLTRFCTHLDVTREDVEEAVDRISGAVDGIRG